MRYVYHVRELQLNWNMNELLESAIAKRLCSCEHKHVSSGVNIVQVRNIGFKRYEAPVNYDTIRSRYLSSNAMSVT